MFKTQDRGLLFSLLVFLGKKTKDKRKKIMDLHWDVSRTLALRTTQEMMTPTR